ncbi:MAG: polyprenyl synthetase family protein [Tissierellales bacterium]|jgi:geranylgeranyl diphosphate synthase type II|nr:polyprenyl synthetase family protein [Tissierellales bacterium]
MDFKTRMEKRALEIETYLDTYFKEVESPNKKVVEAMRYSLLAGGKRLRPVLMIETYEALGGSEDILEMAIALEMIHTYSLIHDDLPSMDDDDYRRGKLTNHKVYGEAMALLAGDGLLNLAYETMINWASKQSNTKNSLKAMNYISKAAGYNGMIGGQVVDVISENKKIDFETLEYIQLKKTAALIKSAMMVPAYALGVDDNILKNIELYAESIGVAFQIRDDLLDEISTFEKLGKDIGSDAKQHKNTYLSFYSKEDTKDALAKFTSDAIEYIESAFENSEFFVQMAKYLEIRDC